MTPRILVTGAGGAAAISFMQAVKGDEVELFAGDIDPYAAGLYVVPPARRVLLRRGDDRGYLDHLVSLCVRHRIDLVVPTVDCELLPVAQARARFAALGVQVAVASDATLRMCLDKALLVLACAGAVPVPRTELLDSSFDEASWTCPFIVKPRVGSGGRGFAVIARPSDLSAHRRDGTMLVQELLPGEEYSVDVFARSDGEVVASVPRLRLKVDSGVAVAARTVKDAELERLGASVARQICLTGVANVQFKRDAGGVPRLLEVNARLPGTMPLTVRSGVNMPRMLIAAALHRGEPTGRVEFAEVAMVRTWQEHYLPVAELLEPEPGPELTPAVYRPSPSRVQPALQAAP